MQRIREFTLPGLALAELTVPVTAPFLSRRWLEALLSGAPSERQDDLARLRLIRSLDPALAAVPWALTRLPVTASIPLVTGARAVSLAAHRLTMNDEHPLDGRERQGGGRHGRGQRAVAMGVVRGAKRRVYSHGDRRDEWLRRDGAEYLRQALLSPDASGEPLLRPDATAGLIRAHLAGDDQSLALGQLLNLRLWERLFVEQDAALREHVRRELGRQEGTSSSAEPAARAA